MERGDYLVIIAGIIVVLILAIVVKPILTGEDVVFLPSSPEPPVDVPVTPVQVIPPVTPGMTNPPTPKPVITEKPFIPDISPTTTYSPQGSLWQPDPDMPMPAISMVPFASITSKYSGKTGTFLMPFPYWEITFSAVPDGTDPIFILDIMEEIRENNRVVDTRLVRTLTWRPDQEPDYRDVRFFEGDRLYYFMVTCQELREYTITILVPKKYLDEWS
ncbi:MAG: hypothetical protein JXA44_08555 [Methanospirillaceae archaeon]|nr:hypothetical protein [Methanospirillaceae archaeon]